MTPSVAAPSDTNPSDATGIIVCKYESSPVTKKAPTLIFFLSYLYNNRDLLAKVFIFLAVRKRKQPKRG